MSTNGRSLGQRMAAEIRAEMARQDISRRQLAERMGESHVTVGRWVKGDTALSLDNLDSICRALGLTVADLLSAVERNGGYEAVRFPISRSAVSGEFVNGRPTSADSQDVTQRFAGARQELAQAFDQVFAVA